MGYQNMAIDEALLSYAIDHKVGFIIRFYGWEKPTVSCGHFQPLKDLNSFIRSENRISNFDLVRRPTGGGWVWHDKDFTLSLIISSKFFPLGRSYEDSYHRIHTLILNTLRASGVHADFYQSDSKETSFHACFQQPVPNDIMFNKKKILGGAQLRRKGFLLYQGTLQWQENNPNPNDFLEAFNQDQMFTLQMFQELEVKLSSYLPDLYDKYQSKRWMEKY